MAKRSFLNATVVPAKTGFVVVIEREGSKWVSFTASPTHYSPHYLKQKIAPHQPGGNWVLSNARDAWGKLPHRSGPGREMYQLGLKAKTLHEATTLVQSWWLPLLGTTCDSVTLTWEDMVFARQKGLTFRLILPERSPFGLSPKQKITDNPAFLTKLEQSPRVKRAWCDNRYFYVQLTRGSEKRESTFQELADLVP